MNLLWVALDIVLGALLVMLWHRTPAGRRMAIGISVAILAFSVAIGIARQLAP